MAAQALDVARARPQAKQYRPAPCGRCGVTISRASSTRRYCDNCRQQIERERGRAAYVRRTATAVRQKGAEASCDICGGVFVCRGGGDRYCLGCIDAAKKKRRAERYRRRRAAEGKVLLGGQIGCADCGAPDRQDQRPQQTMPLVPEGSDQGNDGRSEQAT